MRISIVLVGVGGQGTILASRAIALAAIKRGYQVRSAETLGMAQRGGSVISQLRFGEGIYSALVPAGGADVLLGFELLETARWIGKLKEGGTAIVNSGVVPPAGSATFDGEGVKHYLRGLKAKVTLLEAAGLAREAGSFRSANAVLLGAFSAISEAGLTPQELLEAMLALVPPKTVEINRRAFELGRQAYLQLSGCC